MTKAVWPELPTLLIPPPSPSAGHGAGAAGCLVADQGAGVDGEDGGAVGSLTLSMPPPMPLPPLPAPVPLPPIGLVAGDRTGGHGHRRAGVVVHPAAQPVAPVSAHAAVTALGVVVGHQGVDDRDRAGRESGVPPTLPAARPPPFASPPRPPLLPGPPIAVVVHDRTVLDGGRHPAKEVDDGDAAAAAELPLLVASARAAAGLVVVQRGLEDRRAALEDEDPAAGPVTGAVRRVRRNVCSKLLSSPPTAWLWLNVLWLTCEHGVVPPSPARRV